MGKRDPRVDAYIAKSADFAEDGVRNPARAKPRKKSEVAVPTELASGLKKNRKAATAFER